MSDTKKEYQLKEIESQLLGVATQQYHNLVSNLLSYVSIERLAHPINERTRYELSVDLKSFKVWEEELKAEASAVAKAVKK